MDIHNINFYPEFSFKTSRSGGKGGQNVNKVATKVELDFNITASVLLTEEQKALLLKKLINRVTTEGVLQIVVQTERSQLANKELAVKKFYELVANALKPEKVRKASKVSKSQKAKRLKKKKQHAEKKELRRSNKIRI